MNFETILNEDYRKEYEKEWPNKTILDYLRESIEKGPNKLAIIDNKSRYTYRELGKLVDRVALGLLELGLKKGDVISFQLPNWNEFVILHFAVTRIGAISNPLIPIYRDREIGFMVRMAESKMIVVPDEFRGFNYPEMVNRLLPEWPSIEHVYVVGSNVPTGMKSFSSLLEVPWEERRDPSILDRITHDPNELTEIIFTSGTTGEPKGVMHTHNTVTFSSLTWVDHLKLTPSDTIFMASTFAHQTGFLYGARLPAIYGGTGVYQDIWNPQEFIEWVEREKITLTAGATPFLQDTIQLEELEKFDLSSLCIFIAVGATIPRPLVKQAAQKLPSRILSGWGQTENGMVTFTQMDDTEEKLTNTDGKPFPGMELKVVDALGNTLPPHEEGSLLCRGPALFVGYLKQMELTRSEFDNGWFITGDRATMDEDGYIRITGRNKDIIIRGGENIPVAYVENVLYEHPDISTVQIIAMPDARLQEKACAFISMKPGKTPLTMQTMAELLSEKGMAKQYWPEHLEIIDDFPRTPSGKIKKFRLREIINEKMFRKV
ncbi:cyclohexanecarboxylate-CoA ligase [Peribacillus cavernae]|uniref:Cyclohexanecarboxylate-CoA ligase n=1 Tax=Peribacillus cavernae TaxID=1674310 RepID=A0A3S0UAQ9_9BACI|nr:AMP-binding protein [Peribacillus cavernae]MDQ0219441.1 cyclohexanecarboxylate-CoA ligase [Peribacillus cavernae]RUQ27135.1 cyclohexanecarboxylate-CoA ligase [Peribacillus cavernae]